MKRRLLLAALLVTAGCGPGLRVDSYPTEPDTDVDCQALFADAPRTVKGEDSIAVKDDNAVAWGAPPIVLRCGVERPAKLSPTAACYPVNGVDWFSEEIADGFLFTTIGRKFYVSVEVPDYHEPASDALADLAETITRHNPSVQPCV